MTGYLVNHTGSRVAQTARRSEVAFAGRANTQCLPVAVPRDAEARAFWFTYGYRGKPADTFDVSPMSKVPGTPRSEKLQQPPALRFGAGMLSLRHDM